VHLNNTNAFGSPLEGGHTSVTKKRLGAWLVMLLVSLIVGLMWQMTRQTESSGLVYQGKPLSAWLDEVWHLDGGVDPEAEKAVRQIGTNAIPYLLKLATTRDSTLKTKVSAVLPEKWFVGYTTRSAHNHFSAAFGFQALGPAAKSAVPTLINLLGDKDEDIRKTSSRALGSIGTEAQDAVPGLIKHLSDPARDVAVSSAEALENIPSTSVEEVPALLRALNSPPKELFIAIRVMDRLGQFQSQANAAVPAILPYLRNKDIATRDCAAKALKQIDPEAAAKAGIQ
jgi:HEAT repeat protein